MKRRFLVSGKSSGPVDPVLVPAGVYVYDVEGYAHDLSTWRTSDNDRAAGIMLKIGVNGGNGYYEESMILAKNRGPVSGLSWSRGFSGVDLGDYINTSGAPSGCHNNGMMNTFAMVVFTGSESNIFTRLYAYPYLSMDLTVLGVTKQCLGFVPDQYEAQALCENRERLSAGLAKIGATWSWPTESTLMYTSCQDIINIQRCVCIDMASAQYSYIPMDSTTQAVLLPVYPVSVFRAGNIPGGIYELNSTSDLMLPISVLASYRQAVSVDINVRRMEIYGMTDQGKWMNRNVNTSLTDYTVDTAYGDIDGKSNTRAIMSAYPGDGNNAFSIANALGGYLAAYGEVKRIIDRYGMAFAFWWQKSPYGSYASVWTSTEVNASRAICVARNLNDTYIEEQSDAKGTSYPSMIFFEMS